MTNVDEIIKKIDDLQYGFFMKLTELRNQEIELRKETATATAFVFNELVRSRNELYDEHDELKQKYEELKSQHTKTVIELNEKSKELLNR